jgi:transcriptional regulator with XRE-family HTH domain
MATTRRQIPQHLGKKLKQVREHLGIKTYDEMIARLNIENASLHRASILRFENGEREPSLIVLLKYSQLAGITINDLVDDAVELVFGNN